MTLLDAVLSFLPAKKKITPSGWIKFNAVCCEHNGQTKDRRARAGMIKNSDGVSYHCFNCGFKASYQTGRHLTRKMRQLLSWMGASDDAISKLALEALRIEADETIVSAMTLPEFAGRDLPQGSLSLKSWLDAMQGDLALELADKFAGVASYVMDRGFPQPFWDRFFWSPADGYSDRVILPFTHQGRIVGYTARKIVEGKPKYISDQTPGYVFNLDQQREDHRYIIVVEGPFDALSVGGVALLGSEIMPNQSLQIDQQSKTVILVPDRDSNGARTVEQALAANWSVSFPPWQDCKDSNDAVRRYGRIATIASIIAHRENNPLKIRLRSREWFQEREHAN